MVATAATVAATCASLLSAAPAQAVATPTARPAVAKAATAKPAAAKPAAVTPGTWYTVVNEGSGKCVDARSAATTNGTVVQQYDCNSTTAQEWEFQATSNGYYQVDNNNLASQAWDVTNVSTADSAGIQLWDYVGGNNQQWQPVANSDGSYHFVNLNSGKCLDTPGASTADSVQLDQYDCNGTNAQNFQLDPAGGGTAPPPPPNTPNFGPNVYVFTPSMSSSSIQSTLTSIYNQQVSNQFGTNRYAVLFAPGTYNNIDVNTGFYEEAAGLGLTPDSVDINGNVHVQADWNGGNATENFWRDAENMEIVPPSGTDTWAVSQAAPLRRVDIKGNLQLDDNGWSSGGFLADSEVSGSVNSGSQQQWISRDDQIGSWNGSNWNMVFAGVQGAPNQSFPNPPYTTVSTAPTVQEKPFIYIDSSGNYNVFVPALKQNSSGVDWASGNPAGTSLPISQFYITQPGDTAETINAQLAAGKNLIVTPGIYNLDEPLNVTNPDTVILGLGLATLKPTNGTAAINVADVNGVKLAGLLIDAGATNSSVLVQMGPSGSGADHTADPSSLSDVQFRIGGAGVGKATQSLVVNSNDVLIDDSWLWRADHGDGVGWTTNTAQNGLVVNGNNVTAYGLFVEHYQQYNVIWNGNGGKDYFFQNELPYDPPSQSAYMNGSSDGWAAFKVGNNVTSFQAWGLGSYCNFNDNSIVADHSFEAPQTSGVQFHDMVTVSLGGGAGTIAHIINEEGGPVGPGNPTVADQNSGP
ncbi:MAG TPA: RICIN domain-containing protein [Pseudonocardiaceae bacterium]|nr:RICIN domain-containing protein [Pseudonocardiaceae bacterium]